ncbi:MAG: hypothetical protein RB148_02480, partial [Armatimonadota bacterium]|nr:hypothetical protein [Armatimonadota bacterium]
MQELRGCPSPPSQERAFRIVETAKTIESAAAQVAPACRRAGCCEGHPEVPRPAAHFHISMKNPAENTRFFYLMKDPANWSSLDGRDQCFSVDFCFWLW